VDKHDETGFDGRGVVRRAGARIVVFICAPLACSVRDICDRLLYVIAVATVARLVPPL
jgi:hypothetical protein